MSVKLIFLASQNLNIYFGLKQLNKITSCTPLAEKTSESYHDTEPVARRYKKVLLKILQNSRETTFAGVSFLIKRIMQLYRKRESGKSVSAKFLRALFSLLIHDVVFNVDMTSYDIRRCIDVEITSCVYGEALPVFWAFSNVYDGAFLQK